eukprot:TRINITY_DN2056_c0_g1_i2.p1 TRINITY_DN2056_c0_g1~~TRINITY_DN2056_c0_g1_i2.p1  ORF type:complete len:173 (-),score=26.10 TRINITY_DN2056_c0_g1_i2:17-535(-)
MVKKAHPEAHLKDIAEYLVVLTSLTAAAQYVSYNFQTDDSGKGTQGILVTEDCLLFNSHLSTHDDRAAGQLLRMRQESVAPFLQGDPQNTTCLIVGDTNHDAAFVKQHLESDPEGVACLVTALSAASRPPSERIDHVAVCRTSLTGVRLVANVIEHARQPSDHFPVQVTVIL